MIKSKSRKTRNALTLIELMFVSAMMAALLGGVAMVIRTSHLAWSAHSGDSQMMQNAHATLRHLVRRVRQARSVDAISSNSISLVMADGSISAWAYDGSSTPTTVKYGVTTASNLLAEDITNVSIVGYERDGITATTTVADIRLVRYSVSVELPRNPPVTKTVSSYAWLRSW